MSSPTSNPVSKSGEEMPAHRAASHGEGKSGMTYVPDNVAAAFAADINVSAAPALGSPAVFSPVGLTDEAAPELGKSSTRVPAGSGHAKGEATGLPGKSTLDHAAGGFGSVIDRFGQNLVSAHSSVKDSAPAGQISTKFPGLAGKRLAGQESQQADSSFQGEGLYSKVPGGTFGRRGRVPMNTDESLFPFNYTAGRRSELQISVSRDDRMSPMEAKSKLRDIFIMFGIEAEPHDYLFSFTHSLLVSHALNGASVVGPGRATFSVDGDSYPFGEVLKSLGPNVRRFFRAYADETAKALAIVLNTYDPANPVSANLCGQIRYIAVNRLLTQFPYLIHDSADACVRITNAEMAAVQRSKNSVLRDGVNAVDAMERSVLE